MSIVSKVVEYVVETAGQKGAYSLVMESLSYMSISSPCSPGKLVNKHDYNVIVIEESSVKDNYVSLTPICMSVSLSGIYTSRPQIENVIISSLLCEPWTPYVQNRAHSSDRQGHFYKTCVKRSVYK